ncbi:PTS sugar transporter subunit IIA [Mammaliicoccus lentus]|uniref:PTS sugar transporter subunit IIA n=1 Tax=Mammaliicoccus lentus TaxID=42858 RepID=UPI001B33378D|nr:PTS sugar transporter subunit IIA [Mammaliicoccus lentus]
MDVNLEKVIQKEMIILNEEVKSKDYAIDLLINKAEKLKLISEKEKLKESVIDRETIVSTAIGFDVAMPHGKSETVNQPFIGFLQASNSFKWSENQDEMASLIFLIAVPLEKSNNLHLKFISSLSKKLLDEDYRNKLKEANSKQEAFELLRNITN